jgi:hypothetical protein
MAAQQVTGLTVIAWRNQQRTQTGGRQRFHTLVEEILAEPSPQRTLDTLLRKGPPGYWKS